MRAAVERRARCYDGGVHSDASRPVILVVEDDVDLQRMLRVMLRELGRVVTADDGVDALLKIRDGLRPALIVSDIMMPRMDGLELAQSLSDHPEVADVPIVFLTARNTPKDVIAGIQAGARAYVTKPFKQKELVDKVRRILKAAR